MHLNTQVLGGKITILSANKNMGKEIDRSHISNLYKTAISLVDHKLTAYTTYLHMLASKAMLLTLAATVILPSPS